MNIDQLISHVKSQKDDESIKLTINKEWSQGRTVYGGISAALLYCACKQSISETRILRSLTTNFVGPLMAGKEFEIHVEIIREGKNVSQLQARALQGNKIAIVQQACFAEDRQSKLSVENNEKHELEQPSKANYIPQIPKITPKFIRHFDLSVCSGGIPFTGRKSSHYHGWMRYKKPPAEISDAHIIGLIDAWPPTLLQKLKWPAPASTVSWNLEFIHPHKQLSADDWFAYKAHTRQAANGYGHTEATIWDKYGDVIALSRQTVAVFD